MPIDCTPMLEEALVLVGYGFDTSLGFRANGTRDRRQFATDFRKLAEQVAAVRRGAHENSELVRGAETKAYAGTVAVRIPNTSTAADEPPLAVEP